jgi:hypothetical protein
MRLSAEALDALEDRRDFFVDTEIPDITASTPQGKRLDKKDAALNNAIGELARRKWSRAVLEGPWALLGVYLILQFNIALAPRLFPAWTILPSVPLRHLSGFLQAYWPAAGHWLGFLGDQANVHFYFFLGGLLIWTIRLLQRRTVLSRQGMRQILIAEAPHAHKVLWRLAHRMFANSFGMAGAYVHSENNRDHAIIDFGPQAGTLSVHGIAHSPMSHSKPYEVATVSTAMQYKSSTVKLRGSGAEVVTFGHSDTVSPSATDAHIPLPAAKSPPESVSSPALAALWEGMFDTWARVMAESVFLNKVAEHVSKTFPLRYDRWHTKDQVFQPTTRSPVSPSALALLQQKPKKKQSFAPVELPFDVDESGVSEEKRRPSETPKKETPRPPQALLNGGSNAASGQTTAQPLPRATNGHSTANGAQDPVNTETDSGTRVRTTPAVNGGAPRQDTVAPPKEVWQEFRLINGGVQVRKLTVQEDATVAPGSFNHPETRLADLIQTLLAALPVKTGETPVLIKALSLESAELQMPGFYVDGETLLKLSNKRLTVKDALAQGLMVHIEKPGAGLPPAGWEHPVLLVRPDPAGSYSAVWIDAGRPDRERPDPRPRDYTELSNLVTQMNGGLEKLQQGRIGSIRVLYGKTDTPETLPADARLAGKEEVPGYADPDFFERLIKEGLSIPQKELRENLQLNRRSGSPVMLIGKLAALGGTAAVAFMVVMALSHSTAPASSAAALDLLRGGRGAALFNLLSSSAVLGLLWKHRPSARPAGRRRDAVRPLLSDIRPAVVGLEGLSPAASDRAPALILHVSAGNVGEMAALAAAETAARRGRGLPPPPVFLVLEGGVTRKDFLAALTRWPGRKDGPLTREELTWMERYTADAPASLFASNGTLDAGRAMRTAARALHQDKAAWMLISAEKERWRVTEELKRVLLLVDWKSRVGSALAKDYEAWKRTAVSA